MIGRLINRLQNRRRYRDFHEQAAISGRHDLQTEEGRRACAQELWEAQRKAGPPDPRS